MLVETGLAFASEPRAFLQAGLVGAELSPDRARELLAFNYTLTDETIFKGVRRLAPGAVVEVVGDYAVKKPKRPRAKSIFYTTGGNRLSRSNPKQMNLPLRDVNEAPGQDLRTV